MITRRGFLRTGATSVFAADSVLSGRIAQGRETRNGPSAAARAVRKPSARIKRLIRREETILRLGGQGDGFCMTWGPDNRQFVALCDGAGWLTPPRAYYNSRLFAVRGDPNDAVFEDVRAYPELTSIWKTTNSNRYYGFGTLAVDGRIYQFLSTPNHPFYPPAPGSRFVGAKLIYSPDNGQTWRNQDGSTPVVWESWSQRSRENMVFFEEQQDAFSFLSILQMGRDYAANQDGYVYVYAPNGSVEGTMNELVMFRAPKTRILDRTAYEYFAGLRANGTATWARNIDARAVVHTFPRGWVNTNGAHPYSWQPSVVFNEPLGLYLMVNWGMGCDPTGEWFGKPTYLGFWAASTPWGPWTQIHEESAWMPEGDQHARGYQAQIAPKWIAADGKSFWLVWTDYKTVDENASRAFHERLDRAENPDLDDQLRWAADARRIKPFYSFNTQRVDVILA